MSVSVCVFASISRELYFRSFTSFCACYLWPLLSILGGIGICTSGSNTTSYLHTMARISDAERCREPILWLNKGRHGFDTATNIKLKPQRTPPGTGTIALFQVFSAFYRELVLANWRNYSTTKFGTCRFFLCLARFAVIIFVRFWNSKLIHPFKVIFFEKVMHVYLKQPIMLC